LRAAESSWREPGAGEGDLTDHAQLPDFIRRGLCAAQRGPSDGASGPVQIIVRRTLALDKHVKSRII
jgi:hypothetical protein